MSLISQAQALFFSIRKSRAHSSNSLLLIIGVLLFVLVSFDVNAQRKKKSGSIFFKGKVYIAGSDDRDLLYAEDASISIVMVGRGVDKESDDFKKKYGIFSVKLEIDEKYEIWVSKVGYETKHFEFSTMGAKPKSQYVFSADIVLKEEGKADDYIEEYPVTHIAYDKSGDGFVMLEKE